MNSKASCIELILTEKVAALVKLYFFKKTFTTFQYPYVFLTNFHTYVFFELIHRCLENKNALSEIILPHYDI